MNGIPLGGPMPQRCCEAHPDPATTQRQRNRFFTGKYMTERDFTDEQAYFLSADRLHQRALHGWGVICGFEVVPHSSPECAKQGWVIVKAGMAVDCYGRNLVLEKDTTVEVPKLPEFDESNTGTKSPADVSKPFLLGIRYKESCVEEVPLLYDEQGCGKRTTFNRIAESVDFCWRTFDDKDACWHDPSPKDPCNPCNKAHPCMSPSCPCGGMIPVARVNGGKDWAMTTGRFRFEGVRYLPGPLSPLTLTHICKTSWRHGGQLRVAEMESPTGQKPKGPILATHQGAQQKHHHHQPLHLMITFDRPLKKEGVDYNCGLNAHTFLVEWKRDDSLERLPLPGKVSVHDEDVPGCACAITHALFEMDPHDPRVKAMLHEVMCPHPVTIMVTLKGDFILDHRDRAIDGNFLRGRLPSGDGVEGGLFESWFTLKA